MKKVLALVLAVMMMATVAFAAGDITVGDEVTDPGATGNGIAPGKKIIIYPGAFKNGGVSLDTALERPGDFSSENFSVTTKRFDKGAALVKSVEFDDDENAVVIKLVDKYDLKLGETINLAIKELKISAKKKLNDGAVAKGSKWTYDVDNELTDFRVGHTQVEINIKDDFEVYVDSGVGVTSDAGTSARSASAFGTGKLVKFVKDAASYGTATINFGDIATATGRVYDKDVAFLDYNEDIDVDTVKKYPDAELSFVNFKGNPTFNSTFELEIYADEDQYIYSVKDGVLSAANLKWDDDAYAFTGKVRTLGNYVISDTKLAVGASTGSTNPDTGANDVVGIATALAAVALVSAAAVSLKK